MDEAPVGGLGAFFGHGRVLTEPVALERALRPR